MNALNSAARVANDTVRPNPTSSMTLVECAKAIRAEYKSSGIKASVTCGRGYAINVKVHSGSMRKATEIARSYRDVSYDCATGESLLGSRYVFVDSSDARIQAAADYIVDDCAAALELAATLEDHESAAVGGTLFWVSLDSRGDAEVSSSHFDCHPRSVWARDASGPMNLAKAIARHLIGLS